MVPQELGGAFPSQDELLGGPERAWTALSTSILPAQFPHGAYHQAKRALNADRTAYPFLLVASVQREIFEARYDSPLTERGVADLYLTAYFNAWLDNRHLHASAERKWVIAFEPGAIGRRTAMRRFDELYPDGRVVSVVRDPWTWFVSARRWSSRWRERSLAMDEWCKSTQATIGRKEAHPAATDVLIFEDVVRDTRETMWHLADRLGIEPSESLQAPTFNGMPVKANSSFAVERAEVSRLRSNGARF